MRLFCLLPLLLFATLFSFAATASAQVSVNIGNSFGFGGFTRQRVVTPFVQSSFVASPVFASSVYAQPLVQRVAVGDCGSCVQHVQQVQALAFAPSFAIQAFAAPVHSAAFVQRQFVQRQVVQRQVVQQRVVQKTVVQRSVVRQRIVSH